MGLSGISKSRVSEMAAELDAIVDDFRNRPLVGHFLYLWLDALMLRCREGGRVVQVALVVAIGVTREGHREILGADVITTEDHGGWLAFLRSLVARGLSGVQLVVSDAHAGLRDAIATVLLGSSWQRCRTHFMTNLLSKVPKAAQHFVATVVRSIFAQPDADAVREQHRHVVDQLHPRFPEAAELLDEAGEDVLAFTAFPVAHWHQIWSNNPQERVNREIRRRTDVVGIFPEGSRGRGDASSSRAGAAWLAVNSGAAVVPMAMLGTRRTGEHVEKIPGFRRRLYVEYGEPIRLDDLEHLPRREAVGRANEIIREALAAHVTAAAERTGIPLPTDRPDDVAPEPPEA